MKQFTKTISLILIALIGINAAVFAGEKEKTEDRDVRNFDAVKVSAGIDLYISMGNDESVRVVADEDIIEDVKTEVRGATLHVYMKNNNNWFNIFNWGSSTRRKVYVTARDLIGIDASSGSDVKSENILKGEELKVDVSSGSDVNLDVVYKEVTLSSSSGSDARLSGRAKYFTAGSSSGSDINARDLEAQVCKVRASSGADATVTATDELYASASSGADVRYYGNPKVVDINESSGGDVSGR
ncbi:MAG: head GIN domain-containing protein [Tangfeifania sp.]